MNNKRLPELCDKDKCTACSACYNICPAHAIEMKEDGFGELHPSINPDLCIGCFLCEKTCPELDGNEPERIEAPTVYYAWLKDSAIRRESTSGGAAYAISCEIIRRGGHVWGAAYGPNMVLRYQEANTIEELKPIQKSKYVQSYVLNCFKRIKEELSKGDWVLFCGTDCHVKGLRAFLKKDFERLVTLDLVCHGVPGQGVFLKYKEWLEDKYGDQLINYIPRYKNNNGEEPGYYSVAIFKNKGKVKLQKDDNGYFIGFQHNIFLRPNCYHCTSNGEHRFSDFTVADFWGLGKKAPFTNNRERPKGISMIALNTEKAQSIFKDSSKDLIFGRRSYEEASCSNTQYYKPAIPSPYREEFRKEWKVLSWKELTKKYFRYSMREEIVYWIKRLTPPHLLLYVKSMAKWIK